MTESAVPLILAAQREEGHRCERERFYTAKYTGTVWQLIILAELGANGGDERLRSSCATPRTPSRAASPSTVPRPSAGATAVSSLVSPAT
jgi:hypothetical protein